jgi:hypothetical protein
VSAPKGPTWEELEDWCRHNLVDFKKMRRKIVQLAADRKAKSTLDDMLRLAEEGKTLTGAAWSANQRLWDIAYRDHERAMNVAYPPRPPSEETPK